MNQRDEIKENVRACLARLEQVKHTAPSLGSKLFLVEVNLHAIATLAEAETFVSPVDGRQLGVFDEPRA